MKLTNDDLIKYLDIISKSVVAGRIIDGHLQVNQKLVKNMQDQLTNKANINITISVVIESDSEMKFEI